MIVILAGVTMNALFAWGIYSGLAYVQGVSVYPITRIGRIDTALLPEAAADVARLRPGDRIVRVGGRTVDTWDQVMREIVTGPSDSILIEAEGREPVVARIHRDALAERDQVARAIEPLIPPVIGQVVSGRPAARAGVQVGDTIVAVDGAPVEQWPQVVDLIQARPDEEITLTVGRAGGRSRITARTVAEEEKDSTGRTRTVGRLGLGPHIDERYERVSLGAALGHGARQTAFVSTTIVRLLRGMASGRVSTREVGGPIAIGMQAGQSARLGLAVFLGYMALISVNLAVLNLLPIPVLDGGQFLFLVGEAVLRRPLSPRLRERLTAVGLFLLLLLTVLAFSNDIRRLLGL